MSEHGLQNKITVSLAKVEDEGDVDHYFDKEGVIHKEFWESEFHVQMPERLLKEISSVRP